MRSITSRALRAFPASPERPRLWQRAPRLVSRGFVVRSGRIIGRHALSATRRGSRCARSRECGRMVSVARERAWGRTLIGAASRAGRPPRACLGDRESILPLGRRQRRFACLGVAPRVYARSFVRVGTGASSRKQSALLVDACRPECRAECGANAEPFREHTRGHTR